MIIGWSSGVSLSTLKGDVLIRILSELEIKDGGLSSEWDSRIGGLASLGLFEGKLQQSYVLPLEKELDFSAAILVGRGDRILGVDELRLMFAQIARAAVKLKAEKLVIQIPNGMSNWTAGVDLAAVTHAFSEGLLLGAYIRKHYKQEQSQYGGITSVMFYIEEELAEPEGELWTSGLERGQVFGEATLLARTLTNIPGNMLVPADLAVSAVEIAEKYGFPVEVLDEREIVHKGMGGLWAVGKGSINPPRMIVIRYQGTAHWENAIGLVGKGITFDTGGVSLKRAPGMEDMISDMGGAAAVLGVAEALGKLRPRINVVMVIPAAENMVSANAFKPGDVITSLSGRTIEVLNTDAEGRVVLADALTYAREWGAERIIDIATLTGAVLSTLGDVATGVVTNDEAFLQEFTAASQRTGEKIWPLPAYPEFKDMLKSEVADVRNATGGYGAAITAGLFIGTFAEGKPWIHLDIAGTAFLSKERGVNPKGATGVMVRTLLEWMLSQAEN
ncbi:leucyl aminopeptidase [Paenibacillus wynnii]|uniref:leucyl aminopeptidase n=1 Tax=Paenibacillus wynnii TaxID=268407 RepID=UPI00278E7905|nr:leucyl aminopeptidase [Paenibacillus wynnii]MDQ0195125.1 leucyl aminopeptidase [Paenibacillus wynnii]